MKWKEKESAALSVWSIEMISSLTVHKLDKKLCKIVNFYSLILELSKYMKMTKDTRALKLKQTDWKFKEHTFGS